VAEEEAKEPPLEPILLLIEQNKSGDLSNPSGKIRLGDEQKEVV